MLCILLELAQVPRLLRVEGRTHTKPRRVPNFFPFDIFSQRRSPSAGTLPFPHPDLALGLGTRGLPPGDSSKLHPSWDGLTQQLQ